jgi:predicted MFS family arabinose efflux permease
MANFATWPIVSITGLLLIDIATTFNQSVGIMGQIKTAGSLVGVIFAILLGILSFKYNNKNLLITGLALIAISALGCWISPNFTVILLAYPLTEIGISMVGPMSFSLVGSLLPKEQRTSTISYMFAGMTIGGILGNFLINYFNSLGGWRLVFLGFAFPIALAAATISYSFIPYSKADYSSIGTDISLLSGFRLIFSNKSASSCLLGQAITMASWGGLNAFVGSFWREVFGLSVETVVLITVGNFICYIVGTLFAGRYSNKFGEKKIVVYALLISGVLWVLWIYLRILLLSVCVSYIITVFGGMRGTAINGLVLDQIPAARGTLMSLNRASQSLGTALGVAVGGYLLISYGYSGLFYAYSSFFLLGGLVFFP